MCVCGSVHVCVYTQLVECGVFFLPYSVFILFLFYPCLLCVCIKENNNLKNLVDSISSIYNIKYILLAFKQFSHLDLH